MKSILFLCGGKSDEHEISLISQKCILDALDRKKFRPIVVGISRDGVWHLEKEESFFRGDFRADKIKLNTEAPTVSLVPFCTTAGRGTLISAKESLEFDAVFPILHGPFGEDGTLQGMLDMIGVPYVGSGCGSSWICMDKALAKTLAAHHGVPVAPFVTLLCAQEWETHRSEIAALGFPLFIKPARLGSSVGISKANNLSELETAVKQAFTFDSKVIVEKGIAGRELECAVLGKTQSPRASAVGEILPNTKIGWYSYEAKYLLKDGAETVVPAQLDPAIEQRAKELAQRVFTLLECDGMARVDMFLEQKTDKLFLNEVNTIPGFTPISMYPKMWQASGLSYSDLITTLIELALQN